MLMKLDFDRSLGDRGVSIVRFENGKSINDLHLDHSPIKFKSVNVLTNTT